METGKTGKPALPIGRYFKYAIGEILLVVIGILIALQVSNWNQDRKSRIQEIKIYKEIMSDLELTLKEVNMDMLSHQKCMKSTLKLMQHMVDKKPHNDSVVRFIFDASGDLQVYPKTSGYQALISIGLNLLRNDSVRKNITNLYQLSLKRIIQMGWQEGPTADLNLLIEPFKDKHLEPDLETDNMRIRNYEIDSVEIYPAKIKDYDAFINDTALISALNKSMNNRSWKIKRHYNTSKQLEKTIKMIENELQRIE
jgi:hypothetical protein